MSKGEYFAKLGFAALCRAALEVATRAKRDNVKIPFWENGKIEYGMPDITEEDVVIAEMNRPGRPISM